MARLRLLVLLAIFLAVLWNFGNSGADRPRRPRLAPGPAPNAVRVLPAPEPGDAIYNIADDPPCPKLCSGTAFAVDRRGHWLTARHVVDSCRRIVILTDGGLRLPVLTVRSHPHADVSLLTTRATAPALPLDLSHLLPREDGFHIGFPKGRPGEVYSVLLGRARARQLGRGGAIEPVVAWAEVSRWPARKGSLGGLSGGAVLDREGAVVGVTTAEAPRRGRVISAAPGSMRQLLEASGLGALAQRPPATGDRIDADNYAEVSRQLRARHSVALVLCRA